MLPHSMVRAPAGDSWLDRLLLARDRLLASPRFRRWAVAFPLTRPVARRRARALFDLCAGFVYSQVLLACVRLQLFDFLVEGPRSRAELAQRMGLSEQATARLLEAAVSLRLVQRRGPERFGLGELGAALVENPGIVAMIEHHPLLYEDLRDPVALLRAQGGETALGRYWAYARAERPADLDGGQVAAYSALMSASQSLIAEEVLDTYSLARHSSLLDVGGGDGSFLTAVAARWPQLRLTLFDLPPVAERARRRFAEAGLSDQANAVGGDFFVDPLPRGADIISLVRVIHDHDDAQAVAILSAVREALPSDGTLLLAEPMSGTPGAEPIGGAYFGFYLLAMGHGRARTPEELRALLQEAGFSRMRLLRTRMPLQTRLLIVHPG